MDKQWYYTQGPAQEKKGPVSEVEIQSLISSGQIQATDLLWTDGMANWAPLRALPQWQSSRPTATPSADAAPQDLRRSIELPEGLIGWMTFVAIVNLVGGIFSCITCIGIIWGVFMIIAGTSLLAAKNVLSDIVVTNASLELFFLKLKSFMLMMGIVYIITVILTIIQIVLMFSAIMAAITKATGHP